MDADPLEFHTQRAQAELDLAASARHAAAARAHRDLSRLHLARVEQLAEAPRPQSSAS
jgi:hypothetical protein